MIQRRLRRGSRFGLAEAEEKSNAKERKGYRVFFVCFPCFEGAATDLAELLFGICFENIGRLNPVCCKVRVELLPAGHDSCLVIDGK